MTTMNTSGCVDILQLPVSKDVQNRGPWKIQSTKSHILHSKCSKNEEDCKSDPCDFCVYKKTLELRHLPDMVFPKNSLSLEHTHDNVKLEFNALDALKRVANDKVNIELACAEAWKGSRSEYLEEKIRPFDWTFTTDYMGTITGFLCEETEDRINPDVIARREPMTLYEDLTLFEDEVHDHGIASLTVKMRVMHKSLYILLRYFLRIDRNMVRVNDTRFYHKFEDSYILREYTSRESKIKSLNVPLGMLHEPNFIVHLLPLKYSCYHKLIPQKSINNTEKPSNNESTYDTQSSELSSEVPDTTKTK